MKLEPRSLFLLCLLSVLSCSPRIQSILEYRLKGEETIPHRLTRFDPQGRQVLEEYLEEGRRRRITRTLFKGDQKIKKEVCDYFREYDTCVVRSYTTYLYDSGNHIIKETVFEPEGETRLIREIRNLKRKKVIKIHTWEMRPTFDPRPEDALVLTDTLFYDRKNRMVKALHYNAHFEKPRIESYTYTPKSVTWKRSNTSMDTVITRLYHPMEVKMRRKGLIYDFGDPQKYRYEIEKYKK